MTFRQLQRRCCHHRLQWHRGVMLFMFLATSLSAASFTQSEHSALGFHDLFQHVKVKPAAALSWNNLPMLNGKLLK